MAYRFKKPLRKNLQGSSHTIAKVVRVVRMVRKGPMGACRCGGPFAEMADLFGGSTLICQWCCEPGKAKREPRPLALPRRPKEIVMVKQLKCPTCGEQHNLKISCLQAWTKRQHETAND